MILRGWPRSVETAIGAPSPSPTPDRDATGDLTLAAAQGPARRRPGLWRNRDGATAVEFALIATPLFGLIVAALQISIVFFFDQALQTMTGQAARLIMVGTAQTSYPTAATFKTAVCSYIPAVFVCNNLMIDVESYAGYSAANTAPASPTYDASGNVNNMNYSTGGPGSIVVVRLYYNWPVVGGPFSLGLANSTNGAHLMIGTAVIKNEPYQ